MKKSQNNYYILIIGIIYLIITVIQATIEGLLPAWLYFSTAFVTINITIFESSKFFIIQLINAYQYQIDALDFMESNIQMLNRCDGVDNYLEMLNKAYKNKQKIYDREKCSLNINKLNNLLKVVEFFEFFFCALIILLSSLRVIPYDLNTNRIN